MHYADGICAYTEQCAVVRWGEAVATLVTSSWHCPPHPPLPSSIKPHCWLVAWSVRLTLSMKFCFISTTVIFVCQPSFMSDHPPLFFEVATCTCYTVLQSVTGTKKCFQPQSGELSQSVLASGELSRRLQMVAAVAAAPSCRHLPPPPMSPSVATSHRVPPSVAKCHR